MAVVMVKILYAYKLRSRVKHADNTCPENACLSSHGANDASARGQNIFHIPRDECLARVYAHNNLVY